MLEKFLFTGLGSISGRHRSNIKRIFPDCQITAIPATENISDRKPKNVDKLVSSFKDLDGENFNHLFICSPATFHLRDLNRFYGKNFKCFVEKPVFSDTQIKSDGISSMEMGYSQISVGYCLRFHEGLNFFKNLIKTKKYGDIYRVQVTAGHDITKWRPNKKITSTVTANKNLGGGALLELSHELDYLLWIFGNVQIKSAIVENQLSYAPEVDSLVSVIGTCNEGCVFNLNLDLISPHPQRYCLVNCVDGDLIWDYVRNTVTLKSIDGIKILYDSNTDGIDEMYMAQFKNLFKKKCNFESQGATWADGIRVIDLISKIREYRI